MTDEVKVHDLALHPDARGWLMVGPEEGPISYAYATTCYPGVVKAWHRHAAHTDRMWCVWGVARIVVAREQVALWDGLPNGQYDFEEHVTGPLCPKLLVIPPGTWHGFQALGGEPCVIVNCPDRPYDPNDEERLPVKSIPFEWREVDG
jgi:dTDP-4-dehydrorhamnose 3,5-epimerase